MSEKRKTMDELINEANLSGDALTNANDFAKFLECEGMIAGGEHFTVTYNDKNICYLHVGGEDEVPGPWTVWPDGDFSVDTPELTLSESQKEIAWANVNKCGDCGAGCAPGNTGTVFGKQFENLCSATLAFCNPGGETLELVKTILKARKSSL